MITGPTVPPASAAPQGEQLVGDPLLFSAIHAGVTAALGMCQCKIRPVGVACVPFRQPGVVTGVVGVHGKTSGFVTVNFGQRFAVRAVEGLLQEPLNIEQLCPNVVDGVGEIANLVAGKVKSSLANSQWSFQQITVPSVIVGTGYQITFAQGLTVLTVTYEHVGSDAMTMDERLAHVSVSLMRL